MALAITAAIALLGQNTLRSVEARSGDLIWRTTATQQPEQRLIVVDIDDASLQTLGPWPWPRQQLAQLIHTIGQQGASQQVLDIVFTDARPDDAPLLAAIQQHRPVLAQVFALPDATNPSSTPHAGQPSGALDWPSCPAPFLQATGHLSNHPALAQLGTPPQGHTGHISPNLAHDGVVRHQPAVVCWNNQAYPALSLATMMQATGETTYRPQRGNWWQAPWSLVGQSQSTPPLPLDEDGNIRIAWRQHPSNFISVSARDVLTGQAPPELFRGAWVLIGSSAFGLNDTIATPFSPAAAGLQAHAQIITAWLDGRTPYTPRAAWALELSLTATGLLLLWAAAQHTWQRPHWLLPGLGLLLALGVWVLHATLLVQTAIWLNWATPALSLLLCAVALGSAEHLRSRLERNRLYQHLSSYLPEPVAASLALQAPSGAIRAQSRHVTVMFADIRNFSAYCEARPPQEAAAVLHAFFSTATEIVQRHGGEIEAFQGDAILAVWNGAEDTRPTTDHATRALAAALDLHHASRPVLPDPAPEGLEPLQLGIGIETGVATAGSFGLASRRTHMVMGRTVTIANRLVGMTGDLAHPILVGEGLATQVGTPALPTHLQSLGTFLLDGLRVPLHVYAVPMDVLAPPAQAPSPT